MMVSKDHERLLTDSIPRSDAPPAPKIGVEKTVYNIVNVIALSMKLPAHLHKLPACLHMHRCLSMLTN